ncbi:hypothetical protein [Clostridium sp.]
MDVQEGKLKEGLVVKPEDARNTIRIIELAMESSKEEKVKEFN